VTEARPLTVAICCGADPRVKQAAASASDADGLALGLTPCPPLERWADEHGIPWVAAAPGNHAVTANAAVAATPRAHDVLIIDSDCVIAPDTLQRVKRALSRHALVTVPVRFRDDGSTLSRAVAECRSFDHRYGAPAYKPGLALAAELRARLGRVFDPRVVHGCDSELDWRLRDMGVEPVACAGGAIEHDVTSLLHLLRGAWEFGQDDAFRWHHLRQRRAQSTAAYEFERLRTVLRQVPVQALPVMALSDVTYHAGWARQRLRTLGGRGDRCA
jgi:hypothetical protein